MLVPALTFTSDRVFITAGVAQVPNFINQGFGFMNDGSLAVDTDVPAGTTYCKGFRLNASGAVYGTTTPTGSEVYIEGIPVTPSGQILYESAATVYFASGNPITANGRLATT